MIREVKDVDVLEVGVEGWGPLVDEARLLNGGLRWFVYLTFTVFGPVYHRIWRHLRE